MKPAKKIFSLMAGKWNLIFTTKNLKFNFSAIGLKIFLAAFLEKLDLHSVQLFFLIIDEIFYHEILA